MRRIGHVCRFGRLPPPRLILQWHLTERCNLRCRHCYQAGANADQDLDLEGLLGILDQYVGLLDTFDSQRGDRPRVRGQVTVTGGEPFVRKDFFEFLEELHRRENRLQFAVLTNGTFIDREVARRLARLNPGFVQVSIEGRAETHEKIRGAGSFDQATCALKELKRAGVRAMISFTAHRENYEEFPDVACLGKKLGVVKVWSDRLVPEGTGRGMSELMLDPEETRRYIEVMAGARRKLHRRFFNRTEIALQRSLQFLAGDGPKYRCSAGYSLITIMPNGDLMPCRRLPVVVGNVLETPLSELYFDAPLLAKLRDPEIDVAGCEGCAHEHTCRGGARCLSQAVYGDPFVADPGCFLARHTKPMTRSVA